MTILAFSDRMFSSVSLDVVWTYSWCLHCDICDIIAALITVVLVGLVVQLPAFTTGLCAACDFDRRSLILALAA